MHLYKKGLYTMMLLNPLCVRNEALCMPYPAGIEIESLLPQPALELSGSIENAGHQAFFVGGFVRDALLGRQSNDIDIATDAHWTDVRSIAETAGFSVYETGIAHGTVTAVHPESGLSFEVTTFRTEEGYADGRHPDAVEFVSDIEDDLARRDFTINAIAWSPSRGLVDPYNGAADMQACVIRAVGDPAKRFTEDGLRILRACRFASQLGFRIDDATFRAMVTHKSMLARVSTERITHELDGFLLGEHVCRALLDTVDVLEFAIPELTAMKGCEQRTKYHIYDVLEHTAHVVGNTEPSRVLRWAALCHDMGKPAAAFFDKDGTEHFYGHGDISTRLAAGLLGSLAMSKPFIDEVLLLVKHHDDEVQPTRRSVKRMLSRLGANAEAFRNLAKLKRADAAAQAPMCKPRTELAQQLEAILDDILADGDAFAVRDLKIKGSDLLDIGLPQGPVIGRILEMLLEEVVEGNLENERKALLSQAASMAQAHSADSPS